eukprot:6009071-Prymnesium_polylepis.1
MCAKRPSCSRMLAMLTLSPRLENGSPRPGMKRANVVNEKYSHFGGTRPSSTMASRAPRLQKGLGSRKPRKGSVLHM